MNEYAFPTGDTVTLDRLKFASRQHVSGEFLNGAEAGVMDSLLGGIVVSLQKEVLAEKLPPESVAAHKQVSFSYRVPGSWWQHWKASHGLTWYAGWFVRRWPARWVIEMETKDVEITVNLQKYHTYPEAAIALPELGRPVKFHTLNVESRVR